MDRISLNSFRRLGNFAIVGIVNNVSGYLLFAALTLLGTAAIPAMTASYVLGMFISFFGNRKFTFDHRGSALPAILRFLVVNAVGYGLNFGILALFVNRLHLPQLLVQIFAIVCVAVVTFTLMRIWVFRSPEPDGAEAHE